jgi:hypothetical protein
LIEVVAVAVGEVVKPDLVDVGCVSGLGDVDLALFDELLWVVYVGYFPGLYGGGIGHGRAARPILWQGGGCCHLLVWLACVCHTTIISLIGHPIAKKSPIAGGVHHIRGECLAKGWLISKTLFAWHAREGFAVTINVFQSLASLARNLSYS